MEGNRIGVAAIIVEDPGSVREVNEVLHEHSGIIIGRMGIPYRERNVSVISLVLDASPDEISALTGKLGKIRAVSVKAVMSKGRASGNLFSVSNTGQRKLIPLRSNTKEDLP